MRILKCLPVMPLALLTAFAAKPALSQSDSSPFRRLELPGASEYRTGSGRPGPKYWQQRVDYRITATLDPGRNEVRGSETIHYVNHSPDTLRYLWLFVEQNLCDAKSVTNVLNQPPLVFLDAAFDFSCQGFAGGMQLEYVRLSARTSGQRAASSAGTALKHATYGTTMRIDLPHALAPGASVDLDLGWNFKVPAQGGGRMGHDGPLYEIAQWYPRLCVYDDVRGWNHEPYIGGGEFYLEYGSFDMSLTVPATYIVAATGQLRNPESVLTATQRARLARARTSAAEIAIISREEAGDVAKTRPKASGTLTWRFTADSVRDMAFAAAPGVRWDASGYDGILIESIYRPGADQWEAVNRMAREAIKHFSEQWYRYPYSHATTFEGPIEGMEYPMLTFTPNSRTREDQQWVISHEFGHEWFPMIVGSNERLYPWMDEGFNSFIDLAGAAKYFAGTPYGDTVEANPLHLYAHHGGIAGEQPLISNPVEVHDLFWVGYKKPALMMQLLRHEVLGDERFVSAFREYIRTWAFKHPTPADFFRVMRDASGMELDWFWRGWVMTTARLDQAVDSVTTSAGKGTIVHLHNRGAMVMPAELAVTFDDGTRTVVRLPVEMWNLGPTFDCRVSDNRRVRRVEVDPRQALPDVERKNNVWGQ